MASASIPLETLSAGEYAVIVDVSGEAHWVHRLSEVGLRAGVCLRMLQPGSPCLFEIESSRFSLRSGDQGQVLVRPVSQAEVA